MQNDTLIIALSEFYVPRNLTLEEEQFLVSLFHDDYFDRSDTGTFNQAQFWKNINKAKDLSESGEPGTKSLLSLTLNFYSYLITHVNPHILENAGTINQALIMNKQLAKYINDSYKFLPLSVNTFDMVKNEMKVVLILDNQHFLAVDYSQVSFDALLPLLWSYLISKKTIEAKTQTYNVIPILVGLMGFKMATKTSMDFISSDDFSFIKNFILRCEGSESKQYNTLRNVYSIIDNARESRLLIADTVALQNLTMIYERKIAPNTALADGDLRKILSIVKDKKDQDEISHMVYVITNLLSYTSFRLATILSLKTDCLKTELGKNFIQRKTKTSAGKLENEYVTGEIAALIQEQMEQNKINRNKFERSGYSSDLLFAYELPSNPNRIVPLNIKTYGEFLNKELSEEGFHSRVTATNLRHTYMTNTIRFKNAKDLSAQETAYLTCHAKDETVFKNYLDENVSLRQMLMETHNIEIRGRVELKGKVESKLEVHNDAIVANECGACTAADCHMKSAYLCIVCPSFVTTPEHKPRILKQIEAINQKLINATTQHDRDDLLTIKEAYVLTLEAIIRFEAAKGIPK